MILSKHGDCLANYIRPLKLYGEADERLLWPIFHAVNYRVDQALKKYTDYKSARSQMKRIEYGYAQVSDSRDPMFFNAFAAESDDCYLLCMDANLVWAAMELSAALWNDRFAFPEIGDTSLLSPMPKSLLPIGLRFLQSSPQTRDFDPYVPKCEIRRDASVETAIMLVCSIWFHELGHVVKGHVDYISEATGTPKLRFWERCPPDGSVSGVKSEMEMIALEAAADMFSTAELMLTAMSLDNPYGEAIGSHFMQRLRPMKRWAFCQASKTLFLLLDCEILLIQNFIDSSEEQGTLEEYIDQFKPVSSTHPHAGLRRLLSIENTLTTVLAFCGSYPTDPNPPLESFVNGEFENYVKWVRYGEQETLSHADRYIKPFRKHIDPAQSESDSFAEWRLSLGVSVVSNVRDSFEYFPRLL